MRLIKQVVEELRKGSIVICPTDAVYVYAADPNNKKAFLRLCQLKGVKPEKARFSFLFDDFKQVGAYTIHVDTETYKVMRRVLPGPFTFIFESSREVPNHLKTKKKTIGVRMPDHEIPRELVREMGHPILIATLPVEDDTFGYPADPDEVFEQFGSLVDVFVDGGWCSNTATTVVDCIGGAAEMEVTREGLGDTSLL